MKKGAVVGLRSGGPEMTIDQIEVGYGSPDRYARCQWFDKLRLNSGTFALHSLELRTPNAPGETAVS